MVSAHSLGLAQVADCVILKEADLMALAVTATVIVAEDLRSR